MKFPLRAGDQLVERAAQEVVHSIKVAVERRYPVNGLKRRSPIVRLTGHNIVWGMSVDYMHCILEGVTKQLLEMWLTRTGEIYYIGRPIDGISNCLLQIKPHISFSRLPRTLHARKLWKATEWRCWLLFYVIPCCKGILPLTHLKHFSLLVTGTHLLLREALSDADVALAEKLLEKFVKGVARLYGRKSMTFNVHQLLHLSKSVKILGPLWATYMFPFEGDNGTLLKLVFTAKGVPLQVAERSSIRWRMKELATNHDLGALQQQFGCRLNFVEHFFNTQPHDTGSSPSVKVLGSSTLVQNLSEAESHLLLTMCEHVPQAIMSYSRSIVRRQVVYASCYTRPFKTCTCFVNLLSGSYACVEKIYSLESHETRICLLFCKEVLTYPVHDIPHCVVKRCVMPPTNVLKVGLAGDIYGQCVL